MRVLMLTPSLEQDLRVTPAILVGIYLNLDGLHSQRIVMPNPVRRNPTSIDASDIRPIKP